MMGCGKELTRFSKVVNIVQDAGRVVGASGRVMGSRFFWKGVNVTVMAEISPFRALGPFTS